MAGLSAAAALRAIGIEPILFDKGRRPGGRIASREAGGFAFDDGAPFFENDGNGLRSLLAGWQKEELVAPRAGDDRFIGVPSMNAPLRAMASSFDVRCSTQIHSLAFGLGRWRVAIEHAGADKRGVDNVTFDHLILAVHAPQAVALLATAGVRLPALDEIVYAPCWTIMLAFDEPTDIKPSYLVFPEGPIGSIARKDGKPGHAGPPETLVVHGSPAWSRACLEEGAETVAEALLSALASTLGRNVNPVFVQAHRWRYAQVEAALGGPFLSRPEWNLGLCGDWCLGGVACVRTIRNPVAAARLMLREPPILLAGEGAHKFARDHGVELCSPEEMIAPCRLHHATRSADTVGCVARDRKGNFAVGVSTGGLANKHPAGSALRVAAGLRFSGGEWCRRGGVFGNGRADRTILREVARRVDGGKLIIATVALQVPDSCFETYHRVFTELGVAEVVELYVHDRAETSNTRRLSVFGDAAGIFFTGGDQLRIASQIGNTAVEQGVHEIHARGGVIAGTSAGASVMSETMLVKASSNNSYRIGDLHIAPGLGLNAGCHHRSAFYGTRAYRSAAGRCCTQSAGTRHQHRRRSCDHRRRRWFSSDRQRRGVCRRRLGRNSIEYRRGAFGTGALNL